MLEIDIFQNCSQKYLGVLWGDSWWFGCPNDADMPYRLRLSVHEYTLSECLSEGKWYMCVQGSRLCAVLSDMAWTARLFISEIDLSEWQDTNRQGASVQATPCLTHLHSEVL